MKKNKTMLTVISIFLAVSLVLWTGAMYGSAIILDYEIFPLQYIRKDKTPAPVEGAEGEEGEDVEYVDEELLRELRDEQVDKIVADWASLITYEPKSLDLSEGVNPHPVVTAEPVPSERTREELEKFVDYFNIIDKNTLGEYIDDNPETVEHGYDYMFFDKVDMDNTPTGVKTVLGDEVLAVSAWDNLILVGIDVDGVKGKMAVLKDSKQLGYSVVDDLSYWDPAHVHAQNTGSLLVTNANGYTWNERWNYGIPYGLIKSKGQLLRKTAVPENVIGFTQDGVMTVGKKVNVDEAYNALEYLPILIEDGKTVYQEGSVTTKCARTAIGQTLDGTTLLLTLEGTGADGDFGATIDDVVAIMNRYGAYNASCLSSGKSTMMWWNGRNVIRAHGYSDNGVRLPTAMIISAKPR